MHRDENALLRDMIDEIDVLKRENKALKSSLDGMVYDGTESTLPAPMTTAIVQAIHHCDMGGKQLQASGNLFNEAAAPIWWIDGKGFVRLEIGDKWWPMPGGGE